VKPIGLLGGMWQVLRKDALLEWRTRARLSALIFFALATLLLFSFALGTETLLLRKNAAGYVWLAILFSSTLSLGESFRVEMENRALDGLRLAPANPRAIFLGKAVGNTLLLWLLAAIIWPIAIALFDVQVREGPTVLFGVTLLGCMAISAPGTMYAALSANARSRDVLLPLLLFPVLIPGLLGAVKGTALILEGDPMQQLNSWVSLLGAFNVVYWALGFGLFPVVLEGE
jgi:heme exporter protein B